MRTFGEYRVIRGLREQGAPLQGQGVGPGIGHGDGEPEGESRRVFRDLVPVVDRALSGPSGKTVINDIVSAIMNNDQVPDSVKQELKAKVGARWSSVVDINQGDSPGRGPGLGNINPQGPGRFGMDSVQQASVLPPG